MILSSPFSRQNRNFQTWTNGTGHHNKNKNSNSNINDNLKSSSSFHHHHLKHNNGLIKRPAPEQPAPEKPGPTALPVSNGDPFRSHTLNRLDDLQRRRLNQQQDPLDGPKSSTTHLRRNMSSLGHYEPNRNRNDLYGSPASTNATSQIYAPASIARPSEFNRNHSDYNKAANRWQSPANTTGESHHYAATSFRGAASESGRSGRESAFGHLLERFGTLRRRAKWLRSSHSKTTSGSNASAITSATTTTYQASRGGTNTTISLTPGPAPLPLQPTTLDPLIYATGKRQVEAEDIYAEGLSAIDSNCQKRLLQYESDESIMSEGETRTLIEDRSKVQANYQALVGTLTNWINDELSQQRIIVRDLQDDLYDGQILGNLIERLQHVQLDIVEVTQNEATQRYKLKMVLETINRILALQARWARIRWSVDGILGKNMVEIVQLLVTLALYYRAPVKFPPNVRVMVLVVQKCQGKLVKRSHEVQLTGSIGSGPYLDASLAPSTFANNRQPLPLQNTPKHGDAFDALIESAPEKLILVKQSLVNFVNRHLKKINMSCFDNRVNQILDPEQFSDGLLLVFLIASLEDYFVPLGNLYTVAIPPINSPETTTTTTTNLINSKQLVPDLNNNTGNHIIETALEPTSYINTLPIHKLHNVNLALQLMEEAGIATIKEQVRAEDIVNGDLKSVLRVLYTLFSRYKHL